MKIAVIAYEPMYSYMEKILGSSYKEAQFDYFLMENGKTVSSLLKNIKNDYDAFITGGGIMNLDIRELKEKSDLIIEAVSTDSLGICKTLLRIAVENSLRDFNGVFFDFVHDEKGHKIMEDIIGNDSFLHIPLKDERKKPISVESFDEVESYLKENYESLIEKGLLKIAVTRYSNITSYLEEKGIKYYFVYPSAEHIRNVVETVLLKLQLSRQKLTSPAIIQIISKDSHFDLEEDYNRIKNLLNEYATGLGRDFIIEESFRGLQVFTTLRTLKYITGDFTCCKLGRLLNENGIKNVLIAYGYGNDAFTAHFNSLTALKKIENYDNVSAVFRNEENIMLGRKELSDKESDEFYIKVSQMTNISPQILKKIDSISDKNKISAKKLGEILNVTQRSANRYLTQLHEANMAFKLENAESRGKGRPQELYEICLSK